MPRPALLLPVALVSFAVLLLPPPGRTQGDWTLASAAPPAREGTARAWDVDRGEAVLFGGEQSGIGLADTWT